MRWPFARTFAMRASKELAKRKNAGLGISFPRKYCLGRKTCRWGKWVVWLSTLVDDNSRWCRHRGWGNWRCKR